MKKARNKVLLLLMVFILTCFAISSIAEASNDPFGPIGGSAVVFPYIVKDDPNTVTIVTVVVPNPSGSNSTAQCLHYAYLYKAKGETPTVAVNGVVKYALPCNEYDVFGKTSPNDMVSFDVSGHFGSGNPIFSDTTSSAASAGGHLSLTLGPSIGYLVVEVLQQNPVTKACDLGSVPLKLTGAGNDTDTNSPDGEALILDVANGGASGYRGWNDYYGHDEEAWLFNDYMNVATAFPPSISTSFVVTPFNEGDTFDIAPTLPGVVAYSTTLLKAQSVVVELVATSLGSPPPLQIFDRNENPISSSVPVFVTCIADVPLSDMVDAGVLINPTFVAQGGWADMWNADFSLVAFGGGTDDYDAQDAWVYKKESSSSLGKFMSNIQPYGGYYGYNDCCYQDVP